MRKQTVILTTWLTLPFICLTIIMIWIFVTLDKDKLMADAPPVGAGAGDTGNANALGQWLAGRDPDAISKANDARRTNSAINPFNWPGGTKLTFTHTPPQTRDPSNLEARIVIRSDAIQTILIRHPQQLNNDPSNNPANIQWSITLDPFGPEVTSAHIAIGYRTKDSDSSQWPLTPINLANIEPANTLTSDPIVIPIRTDIVTP